MLISLQSMSLYWEKKTEKTPKPWGKLHAHTRAHTENEFKILYWEIIHKPLLMSSVIKNAVNGKTISIDVSLFCYSWQQSVYRHSGVRNTFLTRQVLLNIDYFFQVFKTPVYDCFNGFIYLLLWNVSNDFLVLTSFLKRSGFFLFVYFLSALLSYTCMIWVSVYSLGYFFDNKTNLLCFF